MFGLFRGRKWFDALGLVSLSITLGTGSCDRGRTEILHPTAENLPPRGSPVIRSEGEPLGLDSTALALWSSVRDDLLSHWEPIAILGQVGMERDAQDVFGMETDLVVDGDRIVILDRRNHAVKIFNKDGRYIEGFGRAGPGPGEFRDPVAIELLADRRLAVIDRGSAIKIYSSTDSVYVYSETRPVGIVPEYSCAAEDRVFVSGQRSEDNTMIHEVPLTAAGTDQHFAAGYQADHWLAANQLSDGPIMCAPAPLRVALAFRRLPIVRAYVADRGVLLWESVNEDYLQPPVVEHRDARGRASISFSNRGARDFAEAMTAVWGHHILLQTVRFEPKPDPADVHLEVRSYLIDAATGQGALISVSLPLVAAVGPDYYVAKWLLPFPRIEIRAVDSRQR